MTNREQWDFRRNSYEFTMVRQLPSPQAFPYRMGGLLARIIRGRKIRDLGKLNRSSTRLENAGTGSRLNNTPTGSST